MAAKQVLHFHTKLVNRQGAILLFTGQPCGIIDTTILSLTLCPILAEWAPCLHMQTFGMTTIYAVFACLAVVLLSPLGALPIGPTFGLLSFESARYLTVVTSDRSVNCRGSDLNSK